MRQSKTKKRESTAALYVRLSRDDNLEGDSYSIGNQKKLLTKIAKEKGYTNLLTFCDDGISGVTMERAGYKDMIKAIEDNKVSAVFVKDLSRLGRNYIEVGKLTEEYLPDHDVRLVAVSDNVDTEEGENDLAPIKNLFNEWYSRDISRKRRISNKIKGNSGEPLSPTPYGYTKDPDGSKHWVIDEEAASVVRRIYSMTLDGLGPHQIADILSGEKIFTPTNYWISKGIPRGGKKTSPDPYHWNHSAIVSILNKQEYCGDVLNFKTYSKSYKNKKRIATDRDDWVVFKDVHKPIIERSVWELVQQYREGKHRRTCSNGEKNMFSGLLVCADCGSNLSFHFNQGNHNIQYFNCMGYNRGKNKICTSTHYIRVDFLEKVVLGEIKRLTKFATQYETEFANIVMGHSIQAAQQEQKMLQNELNGLLGRDRELDILFEKIYEDNVSGKISDERFAKMSSKYEKEQKDINTRMEKIEQEISQSKNRTVTTDMFLATVRKYTRARKLTPRMLNELIEKIEVHQAEKIDGKTVQQLTIHYTCVGDIDIPELSKIPANDVTVNTRQGVAINYAV